MQAYREKKAKSADSKKLLATKAVGLAVMQASLSVLPWATWAVYKASSSFDPAPGMEMIWSTACQVGGQGVQTGKRFGGYGEVGR